MDQHEKGSGRRHFRWLAALGMLTIGPAGCSQPTPSQQILGKWEEIKEDSRGQVFKKVATFTDGKGLAGVEFFKDGSMMWYAHYAKWMLLEDGRLKLDFSVLPGAGDVKKVTFEKDTMILAFSERQLEARAHPSLRASWPYAQALKLAQHNPAVIQELGEPIEAGFLVVGAVNDAGFTGNADLIILAVRADEHGHRPRGRSQERGTVELRQRRRDRQQHGHDDRPAHQTRPARAAHKDQPSASPTRVAAPESLTPVPAGRDPLVRRFQHNVCRPRGGRSDTLGTEEVVGVRAYGTLGAMKQSMSKASGLLR